MFLPSETQWTSGEIILWLSGYYHGESHNTIIQPSALKRDADKLNTYCYGHLLWTSKWWGEVLNTRGRFRTHRAGPSTAPRLTSCTFLRTSRPRTFGRSSSTTIRPDPLYKPISSSQA
jgi:hypothetical protein